MKKYVKNIHEKVYIYRKNPQKLKLFLVSIFQRTDPEKYVQK